MKRFPILLVAAVIGLVLAAPSSFAQTVLGTGIIAQTTSDTPQATGGSENTLASYTLPANSFLATGKRLHIVAEFSTANNTDTKTMKLYFGSQALTVQSVPTGNFVLSLNVVRSGSANQMVWEQLVSGTTASAASVSGTESDAAAIIVKATGNGTTTGDVTLNDFFVQALN